MDFRAKYWLCGFISASAFFEIFRSNAPLTSSSCCPCPHREEPVKVTGSQVVPMATSTGQGNAQELEAGMVEGPSLDEPNALDAEAAETPAPASPAPAAPLTRSTLTSSGHEMDGTDGWPRPSEFAACRKIFLDLGANRATHIRKLFEPKKYKKSPYLPIFDKLFGSGTYRTQPSSVTGLCAFGFEANSRQD